MKKVITQEGQNIYDIAIQEYQDAEFAFKIMADNPSIITDISQYIAPGTKLIINPIEKPNPTGQIYRDRNLLVRTGDEVINDFERIGIGDFVIADHAPPHDVFVVS